MILLVSKSDTAELAVREIAGQAGYAVVRESDIERGLAVVRTVRPDLINCDADIRGARDWRVFLDEGGADTVPLILASRIPTDALWAELLNLGGFDVLTLPFDRVELERVMLSALRQCESQSQSGAIGRRRLSPVH